MGKKIAKAKKETKPAVLAVESDVEESETVLQKKENAKKLTHSLKLATTAALAQIDVKQAAKAVQALQNF